MPALMFRLAAAAVVALALYGVYWSIDNGGYSRGVAEVESKYRDAALIAAKEQAERIKTAQEKHNADQKTIARLAADARRVRVNFPTCPGSASGEGADGGAGVFSNGMDQAFANFQEGVERIIVERCAQLNASAIRQNASLP